VSLTFKRHYRLLILLSMVLSTLVLGLGSQRIVAYTVPGNLEVAADTIDITQTIDPFDDNLVHSIQILISDEEYQQMISVYQQTGEKDYFHADVIIDGVQVSNVGVRLKGNASLRSALGGMGGIGMVGRGQAPGGGEMPGFDPQDMTDFQGLDRGNLPDLEGEGALPQLDPENMPGFEGRQASPGGRPRPPQSPGEGVPQAGGMGQNTQIPLLIKFDEFVSGQIYQGYSRLAIRSAGVSYDASMLQEPVTNDVFRLAGEPATRSAYAGVRLNEGAEQLFTISEVIDETYLKAYFENPDGVLYKAELNATLSYQGEDPSAYADSFTQETRKKEADMGPLIAFLQFLSESDEATFASQLPDYLDVESFAAYLAANNLLVNTDSMAGMGNNFYLYYDDVSGRMTVLYWDGNESLGKLGGSASYDLYFEGGSGMGMFGRMGRSSNTLITRFLGVEEFKALYEASLEQIYQAAFASGAIEQQIEKYAGVVRQANQERSQERSLVDGDVYEQAVADVLEFITQREFYLRGTALLR
jgi:spore coat protein CotH